MPATAQNVALFTSPLFHVSGCHSTLVVGSAGRPQAGDARGSLHARDGPRAHPGARGHVWATVPDDGVAGLRAPGPPRLRHDLGAQRRVRGLAVRRRAAADGARDVPQRDEHLERLRPHRDVVGGHGDLRPGGHRAAHLGRAARARPCTCGSSTTQGTEVADGEHRRGVHRRARSSWRATGTSPRPPPRPSRRRLAPHRRCRPRRRRRVPLHHRPQEGHDHPRRREHLLRGDRAAPGVPPRTSPMPP